MLAFEQQFRQDLDRLLSNEDASIPRNLYELLINVAARLGRDDMYLWNRVTYHQQWANGLLASYRVFIRANPSLPAGPFSYSFGLTKQFIQEFTHPIIYADETLYQQTRTTLHDRLRTNISNTELFRNTPFQPLFATNFAFSIPNSIQFAHTWCVAGSGHGKTTLLTAMLMEHIPEVLRGEASIVLLDSQNVIIPALERLRIWRDNDRLIVIDPTDPIAFSLFDVPDQSSGALAAAIDLVHFAFTHVSGGELTHRQENLFDYLPEFLITAVPNPTIRDFENLLDKDEATNYEQYYDDAPEHVRKFMRGDYVKDKFTVDARMQVLSKMRRMLRLPTFTRMFSAPRTKLNLFKELERGTCIMIRPNKSDMGDTGTQLFGRFWIAQMKAVAQRRQTTQMKTPTFFYIDEAQDYLRGGEPKLASILEQARKENIGATLFCHNSDQFNSPQLVNLLGANTATKIVGSPGSNDLAHFSTYLQCQPSFIMAQEPRKTFAAFIRGSTRNAISFSYPFIDLAKEPQMTHAEWTAMRARNRARYGVDTTAPSLQPSDPPRQKTVGHETTVTFPEYNVTMPCILDTGATFTYFPCPHSVDNNVVTFTIGGREYQKPLIRYFTAVGFDGSRTPPEPVIQMVLTIEGHTAIEEVGLGTKGKEILIGTPFMKGRLRIDPAAKSPGTEQHGTPRKRPQEDRDTEY